MDIQYTIFPYRSRASQYSGKRATLTTYMVLQCEGICLSTANCDLSAILSSPNKRALPKRRLVGTYIGV